MPVAQPLQRFGYAIHATGVQLVLLFLWYEGGIIESEHHVYIYDLSHPSTPI